MSELERMTVLNNIKMQNPHVQMHVSVIDGAARERTFLLVVFFS